MPLSVTPRTIEHRKHYIKKFTKFRGVDFSTDPTQVSDSRSPLCQNLISDLAGFPEKRPGWRTLTSIEAPVNGLFWCVFGTGHGALIAHGGTKLYTIDPQSGEAREIASGMGNARSTAFAHGGKLYLLDGVKYRVLSEEAVEREDGEGYEYSYTLKAVTEGECFVPTTVIGASASGGGTAFEAVNLLTPLRKNSMIGDGSSKVFQLDAKEIDGVTSVSVNGETLEESAYTVDTAKGTVTFATAPGVSPAGSGVDNVVITFSKTVEGYADRINKCRFYAQYGLGSDNRFFLSGNPDAQNVDWCSGLDDPTYFPDTGYTKIGSDTSAIMGYLKQYDALIIVKNDNLQDAELFLRTAESGLNGTPLFPVKQGVKGMGAVSRDAFATLRDDPLFLSKQGVLAIAADSVSQQRVLQDRSYCVNARLTAEPNLSEAVAVVWNGWYVLAVNGKCFVADGRQRTSDSLSEQNGYEWYYWTGIPARVFLELDGALFFGTEDGRVCRFNTDITTMRRYSDDDAPIEAIWSTKMEDFGSITRQKTLLRKGSGVMIKPYTRSGIEIYAATEREHKRLLRAFNMDILDFSDMDFSRIDFNTFDEPQVKPLHTKLKNFTLLQLVFRNARPAEGFGVYGAQLEYVYGRYVR